MQATGRGLPPAPRYTHNSRIMAIQAKLAQRALELLALPPSAGPRLLLDLGCGSGLSGQELSDQVSGAALARHLGETVT